MLVSRRPPRPLLHRHRCSFRSLDAILHRIILYCSFRYIFAVSLVATSFSYNLPSSPNNNMIVLLIFPASSAKVSFSLLILLFRWQYFFYFLPGSVRLGSSGGGFSAHTHKVYGQIDTDKICRKHSIHANHLHNKCDRASPLAQSSAIVAHIFTRMMSIEQQ